MAFMTVRTNSKELEPVMTINISTIRNVRKNPLNLCGIIVLKSGTVVETIEDWEDLNTKFRSMR